MSTRTSMMGLKDILKLDPKLIIPTIIRQSRASITHNKMMHIAKRELFLMARNKFLSRIGNTLLRNVDYLKSKYDMSNDRFFEFVVSKTTNTHSIAINPKILNNGFNSFDEAMEYSFCVGYAFNIDHETLMYENLEFLDSRGLFDPFKYYVCDPADLKKA